MSDLGEDVATLSYERALRAHARYKPADRGDWPAQPRAERDAASSDGSPANGAPAKGLKQRRRKQAQARCD